MNNSSNILLSVCVVTYNQEKYITQTLEGIINQITDFDFEVIVRDDFSLDKTHEICTKLEATNTKKIRVLKSDENLGMISNLLTILANCNGKYIALCEGDDYWIDPYKLQKQVDFLENNPDYSICFHNVKIFNETHQTFIEDTITRKVNSTTTLNDLAYGNYLHTPSVVLRNQNLNFPNWFKDVPMGDYPLWCLTALKGKIYKMPNEMAVYRVHDQGIMNSYKNKSLEKKIAFNEGFLPFYQYMYKHSGIKEFRKQFIHLLFANQSYAIRANQLNLAKTYTKQLLKLHLFNLSLKQLASTLLALFFPSLLKKYYGK